MVNLEIQKLEQDIDTRLEQFVGPDSKQHYPYLYSLFEELRNLNDEYPVYLCGGAVRDILLSSNNLPRDLDIVIGHISIRKLETFFSGRIKGKIIFGGLKLQIKDWSVDIWPLQDTWAFKDKKVAGNKFSDYPKVPFLNIEAIVVQLFKSKGQKRKMYSKGFFEAILTKTIEINFEENPYPSRCVIQALRIANKYKFAIGPRLTNYINCYFKKKGSNNMNWQEFLKKIDYENKTIKKVRHQGYFLECIKDQTEKICLAAVKADGDVLRYVKNQTEKICIEAVKQNGEALRFVKEQTEKICIEAIKKNPWALEYVKNQTKELCLVAVKQYGRILQYVKERTPEICLAAVKEDGSALQYVENKTERMCLIAVEQDGIFLLYIEEEQTPELCLAAVKKNPYALIYVKNQTREICLEAVKKNGVTLQYVKKQTPDICLAAVKQNGKALEYVKEQTPEICIKAIEQNENAFQYVNKKIFRNKGAKK